MNETAQSLRLVFGQASQRMDWIAENLANTRTPGYRAGGMVSGPFSQMLSGRVTAARQQTITDLTPGAIRMTDRPLDFAVHGPGFFVVRNEEATYLTRNGAFQRAADGAVTTTAGHEVLGADGEPLRIPPAVRTEEIMVGEDGTLAVDGVPFGTLRVETVADTGDLQRIGTTLFRAPEDSRSVLEGAQVVGRSLESSNTEAFQSMAEMMMLTRAVEAAERTQRAELDAQRKMMDALA